jgi:hypothetical protein
MRKRVPKIIKGGLRSNAGRKFSSSKKLPKAQPGIETGSRYYDNRGVFNPMFRGYYNIPTNYVDQVYGTGPLPFGTRESSYKSDFDQYAPNPNMYAGDPKAYFKALNKFKRDFRKQYKNNLTDFYSGYDSDPNYTDRSFPRRYLRNKKRDQLINFNRSLTNYVNDQKDLIQDASKPVGRGRANKLFT